MANPYRYSSDTTGLLDLLADYGNTSTTSDLLELLAGWQGPVNGFTAPQTGGQTPVQVIGEQQPPRPSPQQTPFLNAQQQPATATQTQQVPVGTGPTSEQQQLPFNPDAYAPPAQEMRSDPTGPAQGAYNDGTDVDEEGSNMTVIILVVAVAVGAFLWWKYKR